jgi:hypothetical protein
LPNGVVPQSRLGSERIERFLANLCFCCDEHRLSL